MVLNNPLFVARNSRSGYQIEQSLRFNNESENVYLSKTFGSDGNRKKWTWSAWIKLGRVSDEGHVFEAYTGSGDYELFMRFNSNDSIRFGQFTSTAYDWKLDTTAKYRDPSAWYHVILVFDSDNATSSDRARIYVNGERVTAFDSPTYPASGANGYVNKSGYPHYLCNSGLTTRDFGGYLAEVNFIDGVAVTDALDFGEYDDNGVWRPIKYTGSYTGNSFYLKFNAADVDGDSSGLGNDFTATGVTTSGTGTDIMSDTPTTNWCTLNPLAASNGTLSEGNLRYQPSGNNASVWSTFAVNSGKWYWEVTKDGGDMALMLSQEPKFNGFQPENVTTALSARMYYSSGGSSANSFKYNGGSTAFPSGFGDDTNGNIYSFMLDFDAGTFKIRRNNDSGTEASFTMPAALTAQPLHIGYSVATTWPSGDFTYNFGQRDFEYTPPAGHLALNTSNLPAPDIADGSQYFNTITYSGNGSQPRSLTGVGFQPSWLWIKRRDNSNLHNVTDEVRGASTGALATDSTLAEFSSQIGSFDSDGFTTNSNAGQAVNGSGSTYVAWSWLASNTSGSSNTDGTITSTVSANQTAGFSIITYTGNGSSSATVGHSLGATPAMIITKARAGTNADNSWYSWHKGLSSGYNIRLDSTGTELDTSSATSGVIAAPTNTTTFGFTAGSNVINVNENSTTYIAYCFAEIEGYSKFGIYTANGSSDGPFVYCGFRPALILFKNTDATEAWSIFDSTRNDYNGPDAKMLLPSSSAAEATSSNRDIDFLSNGFKIRVSALNPNTASGNVYIFAAFAENPFGGDGVSPATAR